jgi:hypothetical protein
MELSRRETDRPHIDGYQDDEGRILAAVGDEGYVLFGAVCRTYLGQQAQYASRYINGMGVEPDLGFHLQFSGDPLNHHSLGIHPKDVPKFVQRVLDYRTATTGEMQEIVDGQRQFREATPAEELLALGRLTEIGIQIS